MKTEVLIAGYGGQGILFAGKFLAYNGILEKKEVCWLPSYGPEMRGGSASCGVILSDEPVGSPMVVAPDILVAMNQPLLEKYIDAVKPGGSVYLDSSIIQTKVKRKDVTVHYIPATAIASDNNMQSLANMVMMGNVLKDLNSTDEIISQTLSKIISAKRADMLEINFKALSLGKNL